MLEGGAFDALTKNSSAAVGEKNRTENEVEPDPGASLMFHFEYDAYHKLWFLISFITLVAILLLFFHETKLSNLSKTIPESILLILLGLVAGVIAMEIPWGESATFDRAVHKIGSEIFFNFLLPPIILDAAYNLYCKHFLFNLDGILLLAIVGTLLNTFAIGLTVYAIYYFWQSKEAGDPNLNLLEVLTLSAMISAVDPVAVLSVFNQLGVQRSLYILIFGESLLNDGVGVVVFDTLEKITFAEVDRTTYIYAVLSFFPVAFGGALIGLIYGLLSSLACKYTSPDNKILEPTLIILSAYLSFLNAQLFHWSGIMALIACGLTQKRYGFQNIFEKSKVTVEIGVSILATIAETIIFLVLGFKVLDQDVVWNYKLIILTVTSCIIHRFIITYLIGYAINCYRLHKLSFNHMFMMSYGGLRGAVAFAMAASLKRNEVKDVFMGTVLATVLFTVFVQGSTIKCLVNLMHFREQDHADNFTSVTIKRVNYHLLAGMETILGGGGGSLINMWMKIEKLDRKYMQPLMCKEEQEQKKKFETLKKQGKDHGRNNVLWGVHDYSKKLVARVKKDNSLGGYLKKTPRTAPSQEKREQVKKFKKAIEVSSKQELRESILLSDNHPSQAWKRKENMIRAMGHASGSTSPPHSSADENDKLETPSARKTYKKNTTAPPQDVGKENRAEGEMSPTVWEDTTPSTSKAKESDVESGLRKRSPSKALKYKPISSSSQEAKATTKKRSKRSTSGSSEDRGDRETGRRLRRKLIMGSGTVLLTKSSHR